MKTRHVVLTAAAMLLCSVGFASAQSTNHPGPGGAASQSNSEDSAAKGKLPGSTPGMTAPQDRLGGTRHMGTTGMGTKGSMSTGGTSNNAGAGTADQSGSASQKR